MVHNEERIEMNQLRKEKRPKTASIFLVYDAPYKQSEHHLQYTQDKKGGVGGRRTVGDLGYHTPWTDFEIFITVRMYSTARRVSATIMVGSERSCLQKSFTKTLRLVLVALSSLRSNRPVKNG